MFAGAIATNRGRPRLFAAVFLVGAALPSISWSQVPVAPDAMSNVSIRLQSTGGRPVEGALVALLDARDRVVVEGLSTEAGTRVLRAPAGTYRVRARRIGFLPFISTPIVLPRRDELLLVVWGEVDKALRASQLTTADLAGFGRVRTYRKELGTDGSVVSNDTPVH